MTADRPNTLPPAGKNEEKAVKKQLLCAVALGLAAIAGTASAQENLNVRTTVTPRCSAMPTVAQPLALGELANENGQLVSQFAGTSNIELGAYWCNAPVNVTLKTTPLVNTQVTTVSDASSFTNRVDYTAAWAWDDQSDSKSSAAADKIHPTPEANTGTLSVSVSNPVAEGNRRPVAGAYEGTVTLTVAVSS